MDFLLNSELISDELITFILRLSLIVLLSGLIGLEREFKNHPAGLRTHILVGVGACLLMLLSLFGFQDYIYENLQTTYDPSRIPSYVISGIGFLGAGTIMVQGGVTVKGLTTAASIWTVAGLGLVVGAGMYLEAVLVTIIIITTLLFLDKLEDKIFKKKNKLQNQYFVSIVIDSEKNDLAMINHLLSDKKIQVIKFNMKHHNSNNLTTYTFRIKAPNTLNYMDITELLQTLPSLHKLSVDLQN
ncbi:MgtC/SapB family protein [Bacillus sp. DJP31]|uniref:MgtC/SapB family protein n=1 Tax=Bacillus sp. DJP31 TaxID=3409789 RepID=UPI003BB4A590